MEPNTVRHLLYETYQLILNDKKKDTGHSGLPGILANFVNWEKDLSRWNWDELIEKSRHHLIQSHPDKNTSSTEQLQQAKLLLQVLKLLRTDTLLWTKMKMFLQCLQPENSSSAPLQPISATKSPTINEYLLRTSIHVKTLSIVPLLRKFTFQDDLFQKEIDAQQSQFLTLAPYWTMDQYFTQLENWSLFLIQLWFQNFFPSLKVPSLLEWRSTRSDNQQNKNEMILQLIQVPCWVPDLHFLSIQLLKPFSNGPKKYVAFFESVNKDLVTLMRETQTLDLKVVATKSDIFLNDFWTLFDTRRPAKRKQPSMTTQSQDLVQNDDRVYVLPLPTDPNKVQIYHFFREIIFQLSFNPQTDQYRYIDTEKDYQHLRIQLQCKRTKKQQQIGSAYRHLVKQFPQLHKHHYCRILTLTLQSLLLGEDKQQQPLGSCPKDHILYMVQTDDSKKENYLVTTIASSATSLTPSAKQELLAKFQAYLTLEIKNRPTNATIKRISVVLDEIPLSELKDRNLRVEALVDKYYGPKPYYTKTVRLFRKFLRFQQTTLI